MKTRSLALGGFVVVALSLAVVLVTALGSGHWFGGGQTRAVVWFDKNVKGLTVGAPVTFRGVPIGQVESIEVELDPKTLQSRMPVTLAISTDAMSLKSKGAQSQRQALSSLIDRGLVAQMVTQSLVTGQAMIDLSINPEKARPIAQAEDGPLRIPQVGGALDRLIDQASELSLKDTVAEFRSTMKSIQLLADDARKTVVLLQRDVGQLAGHASQTTQGIGEDFHKVAGEAQRSLISIRGFADQGQSMLNQAGPEITQAAQSINVAAGEMQTSMAELSDWVAPGSPARVNLDSTLQDLSRSARTFTLFVEDMEEQPNALIFGRSNDR